jgi:hypothetical protein
VIKPVIKFSHLYTKLPLDILKYPGAKLYQVFVIDSSELTPIMVHYDTEYLYDVDCKQGFYPLPKGKCLLLIFQHWVSRDIPIIFTTIRRWTPEKERYYKGLTNQVFDVRITEEDLR